MIRRLSVAVSLALSTGACSFTTSSTNADAALSGELWYVRTDTFLGIPVSSSIYYCPAPTSGPAECTQAALVEVGDVAPTRAATPPQQAEEEDPDPSILWSVVTTKKGAEGCAEVRAALSQDEACSAEQCRGPLALAAVHLARCATDDPDVASVRALQKAWKAEVKGPPDACFRALLRLARSRSENVARNYAQQCLKERPPNAIEKAVTGQAAPAENPKPANPDKP